jgi:hypothetical protein
MRKKGFNYIGLKAVDGSTSTDFIVKNVPVVVRLEKPVLTGSEIGLDETDRKRKADSDLSPKPVFVKIQKT